MKHDFKDLPYCGAGTSLIAVSSPTGVEPDMARLPYQKPQLMAYGQLQQITLQGSPTGFGADGICAPGGQGLDDMAANYDPDCV